MNEAHAALHEAEERCPEVWGTLLRAHEALHRVGAGVPRVDCATHDPEAQRLYAELRARMEAPLPCGHTLADLIGGTETGPDGRERPSMTRCGACLGVRQPEIRAKNEARGILISGLRASIDRGSFGNFAADAEQWCAAYFGKDWPTAGGDAPPMGVASSGRGGAT